MTLTVEQWALKYGVLGALLILALEFLAIATIVLAGFNPAVIYEQGLVIWIAVAAIISTVTIIAGIAARTDRIEPRV